MPSTSKTPDPSDAAELQQRIKAVVAGMDPAEAQDVLRALLLVGAERLQPLEDPPRPHRRHPRRDDVVTYRIRIDLEQAQPPIWRRLDVRSDLTLDGVHNAIQASFEWLDYHLHRFALGDSVWDRAAELFLCPFDVEEGEDDGAPASAVHLDETLAQPGDRLRYCYDYGDSWELVLQLEEIRPRTDCDPDVVCVDGRRAAPPEDCGSLRTAEDLATVLPDPAYFDLEAINTALQDPFVGLRTNGLRDDLVDLLTRLRGEVYGDDLVARAATVAWGKPSELSDDELDVALRPLQWFLDRVGSEGLALTAAGYLKPVDTKALYPLLPECAGWIGTPSRESDCYPILAFREALQALGLVRKVRGRLELTKAGSAARTERAALWAHLTKRLPPGSDKQMERPAGLLVLLCAATADGGDAVPYELVAEALTDLGWRMGRGSVDNYAVRHAAAGVIHLLDNLVIGPWPNSWRDRAPSPVAVALARAALRARDHGANVRIGLAGGPPLMRSVDLRFSTDFPRSGSRPPIDPVSAARSR